MNNSIIKIKQQIVVIICCFSFLSSFAQPQTLTENAEICVLTCGTANEMHTLFGHTALRIKDNDQNLDVVYNWGMFDFKTPNFLAKFIKGDLLYYLDVDRFDEFLDDYTFDNRQVFEQQLNLSYDQKLKIWDEINRQLKSDERFYTYGFIRNNCTTKVVDVINKVIDKPLAVDFPSNNHSYRYILNDGLENHYFEKLGINLLFSYPTNKKADLIFLPLKFKDGIAFNKSILKSEKKLNTVNKKEKKFSFNSVYTLWLIVIVLALGILNRKARLWYFGFTAIFSLFLLTISLYTNHAELHFNALTLFYNPLFFVALVLKNKKILITAAVLIAISLIFIGIEFMMVAVPLIVLHIVYVLALFLSRARSV